MRVVGVLPAMVLAAAGLSEVFSAERVVTQPSPTVSTDPRFFAPAGKTAIAGETASRPGPLIIHHLPDALMKTAGSRAPFFGRLPSELSHLENRPRPFFGQKPLAAAGAKGPYFGRRPVGTPPADVMTPQLPVSKSP